MVIIYHVKNYLQLFNSFSQKTHLYPLYNRILSSHTVMYDNVHVYTIIIWSNNNDKHHVYCVLKIQLYIVCTCYNKMLRRLHLIFMSCVVGTAKNNVLWWQDNNLSQKLKFNKNIDHHYENFFLLCFLLLLCLKKLHIIW